MYLYCICVCGHVCVKVRLFLYAITCPRNGSIPDTSKTIYLKSYGPSSFCISLLLWGRDSCHADSNDAHVCKSLPQTCNSATSGCSVCPEICLHEYVVSLAYKYGSKLASTHINTFASGNDLLAGGLKICFVDKSWYLHPSKAHPSTSKGSKRWHIFLIAKIIFLLDEKAAIF